MSFMIPEITDCQQWLLAETSEGTACIPWDDAPKTVQDFLYACEGYGFDANEIPEAVADKIADYVGGKVESIDKIFGFGARLSAPGHLDCTDWTVHNTEREAAQYLLDMYGRFDDEPEEWEAELEKIANKQTTTPKG